MLKFWKSKKEKLDESIEKYKQRLEKLKLESDDFEIVNNHICFLKDGVYIIPDLFGEKYISKDMITSILNLEKRN